MRNALPAEAELWRFTARFMPLGRLRVDRTVIPTPFRRLMFRIVPPGLLQGADHSTLDAKILPCLSRLYAMVHRDPLVSACTFDGLPASKNFVSAE